MNRDGHRMWLTNPENGAPTRAECECGWVWERPADDPHSDTLPDAARAHRQAVA